jgi:hypothetical protein
MTGPTGYILDGEVVNPWDIAQYNDPLAGRQESRNVNEWWTVVVRQLVDTASEIDPAIPCPHFEPRSGSAEDVATIASSRD